MNFLVEQPLCYLLKDYLNEKDLSILKRVSKECYKTFVIDFSYKSVINYIFKGYNKEGISNMPNIKDLNNSQILDLLWLGYIDNNSFLINKCLDIIIDRVNNNIFFDLNDIRYTDIEYKIKEHGIYHL